MKIDRRKSFTSELAPRARALLLFVTEPPQQGDKLIPSEVGRAGTKPLKKFLGRAHSVSAFVTKSSYKTGKGKSRRIWSRRRVLSALNSCYYAVWRVF
jgi:hypothetical protein